MTSPKEHEYNSEKKDFMKFNDTKIFYRTTEEIQSGELQWPFWTKLVVVAIGTIDRLRIKTSQNLFRKKHPRTKTFFRKKTSQN